jgi:hydrogenase-4 component B
MTMTWLIFGMLCIALSGVPGLLYDRRSDAGERPAAVLVVVGCLACLAGIGGALLHGGAELQLAWAVPAGRFALRVDALAAAFLLPLLLVVATGAVYGLGYWPQRAHPDNGRKLRLNYGLISAAMILLLCARNGVLFLVAWEVMALAGFFLITAEDRRAEVRRAGYIYLIATHTGTLALFGLFALLGHATGSALWPAAGTLPAAGSTALFLLGLFGFGMKAGLMPLHIWLPGAHAAAPSHASALLSGVMIKTGIYGLVRLTSLFAVIPPWWGWTLLLTGAVSGILGVALALAQHDIKRLLAYHSVENIGIIAMGLGLALLGRSFGQPQLVLLGLAGCLLHVANHGLFKSLLFLSAGSVIHATGSRDLDHFGGLLKLQRWTGLFFLGGAVAISGLPPFNGFISEWLIYLGAFHAVGHPGRGLYLALLAAPALALIGGLALACFVKVFGVTFLGAPRTPEAQQAHEAPASMLAPMALLLAACAWIGLLPGSVAPLLAAAAGNWNGSALPPLTARLAPLSRVGLAGWVLLLLLAGLGLWLRRRRAGVGATGETWGCGYRFPTPRMQYTASSFADTLVGLFRFGLWSERHGAEVAGLFPGAASFASHTPDVVLDRALTPAATGLARLFRWLRRTVQHGVTAIYLLYVAAALVVLLTLFTR